MGERGRVRTSGAGQPAGRAVLASILSVGAVGGVIGLVAVVIAASFASLIFAGPLPTHLPDGIRLVLVSMVVVATVTALGSSYRGTIAGAQDNVAIVFALIAGAVVAGAPADMATDELFTTVVATIVLATTMTGVAFFVLGRFRLGELIRYIPYPVIGGFLAGTGWLLVVGAVDVATGVEPALATVPALLAPDALVRWAPAAVFALVLLIALRRRRSVLLLPGALVAAIALFYVTLGMTGTDLASARAAGWLLGPFADGGSLGLGAAAVPSADWGLVVSQIGTIGTLVVIASVSLLLNASGLEIAVDKDLDLNRELQTAGLANILTGLGGGVVGYPWTSISVMAHRLGAARRATGLVVAGLCLAVLLVGLDVVAYIPIPVVAALLLLLGFVFLTDWLLDGRRRLPRGDFLVVVAIVAVIAMVGLLEGVAVGLLLALGMFVVRYSRTAVVKHALSGTAYDSLVDRRAEERQLLAEQGERVFVLELQGYLFFGTATRLYRIAEARVDAAPPLTFLVLDFSRVSGVESSAVFSFVKLHRLVARHGGRIVLTGLSPAARAQLARAALPLGPEGDVPQFPDLGRAVEWCEDELLAEARGPSAAAGTGERTTAAEVLGIDPERLEPYVMRRCFAPGEALITEGQPAPGLAVVESGRVTVVFERAEQAPLRLRTMRAGTVVGELSYFLEEPATASVLAEGEVVAGFLPTAALARMEREEPDLSARVLRAVSTLLAARLAASNRTVRDLRAPG